MVSSLTNAYWHTAKGIYYFNVHIHNKIDSLAGSMTTGTWMIGPLPGTDGSGLDSTPNVTTCLNMLNSMGPGGGLHSFPTTVNSTTTNTSSCVEFCVDPY